MPFGIPLGHAAIGSPRDDFVGAGLGGQVHGELGALRLRDGLHHYHAGVGLGRKSHGVDKRGQMILARNGLDGGQGGGARAVDELEPLPYAKALDRHRVAALGTFEPHRLAHAGLRKIGVDKDRQRH